MARLTITAPGVINGSVRAENGGPDFVASSPGAALGVPQLHDGTAGAAPGLGAGVPQLRIASAVARRCARGLVTRTRHVRIHRQHFAVRKQCPTFFVVFVELGGLVQLRPTHVRFIKVGRERCALHL